jgi:nitrogen fixation NifU-like protein
MRDDPYDDSILDHYEKPYHRGHLLRPTIVHEDENPLCGDRVRLELLIERTGRIREAWFEGQGCAISQAAASILVRHIEGRTIDELAAFNEAEMLDLLRVRLTASRQNCGLLAFRVLQKTLCTFRIQEAEHG